MIYFLIGYMWLFIHRPFEVWPWLAEFRIERVYMLCTILFWLTQPKVWYPLRSHLPVSLLAGTYLLAALTTPYVNIESIPKVENWFKVLVFYFLVVSTIRSERDLKILIVGFVCATALYELHSLREYFCGRGKFEMGTWRMIGVDVTLSHPNSFGSSVNYALPFLFPVWTLAQRRWQKLVLIAFGGIGFACILFTGSRSSLAALVVLVILISLTSEYRWRILLSLLIVPPLIWGSVRGDLQDRYMSLIDPSRGVGAAQASAEGRTKSFFDGVHSYIENPIFGAGLGSYYNHTGFATHNLYNDAMGELGSLGLAVLLSFAWAFAANYREATHIYLSLRADDLEMLFLYRVCLAALLSCVLLFFLGWGAHNLDRYNWLWFGAFSSLAVQFLRAGYQPACAEELVDGDGILSRFRRYTTSHCSACN